MPEKSDDRLERASWCKGINCPYYPGYGSCILASSVGRGWFSTNRRREVLEDYRYLAQEDPEKIIELCARRFLE